MRTAGVAGDTLTLSLAEAQRLALAQNPAFLAERQETEIARGELRQARVYEGSTLVVIANALRLLGYRTGV